MESRLRRASCRDAGRPLLSADASISRRPNRNTSYETEAGVFVDLIPLMYGVPIAFKHEFPLPRSHVDRGVELDLRPFQRVAVVGVDLEGRSLTGFRRRKEVPERLRPRVLEPLVGAGILLPTRDSDDLRRHGIQE